METVTKNQDLLASLSTKYGMERDALVELSNQIRYNVNGGLKQKGRSVGDEEWTAEMSRLFVKNETTKGDVLGKQFCRPVGKERDEAWNLFWNLGKLARESLTTKVMEEGKIPESVKKVSFGEPIEADQSVWTNSIQEAHLAGGRLFGGKNAIVTRYEGGVVVEQMMIRDKYTCILASLEMVLAQSGDIGGKTLRNRPGYLLDLKGEMIDLTNGIAGIINKGSEGTLMLQDRENLKSYLGKLKTHLASEKVSEPNCGTVEVLDTLDMDKDGVAKQGLILASMMEDWKNGENSVYMITLTADMSKPGSELRMRNGHEVVIIGALNEGNELLMVMLDPMTGKRKINVDDLVKKMGTSGVIKANSLKRPQEMSALDNKSRIVWG